MTQKSLGYKDSQAPPCYLIPTFAACQVVGNPCDLCYNFSSSSSFFISYSCPFCLLFVRVEGYLQHLITLNDTHTNTRQAFCGRGIGRPQRPLPDRAQHSKQTDIHSLGGIRNRNLNKRAAADPRLKSRSHRDRLCSSSRHKIEASAMLFGDITQ